MAREYTQGKYNLINPSKYKGDRNNIIFRSSWEKRFFLWVDTNPSVIEWSSEEVVIPYLCGTDGRIHRYFVDACITVRSTDGKIGKFLVEIKPYHQTQKPVYPGRQTQSYLNECETYVKNMSKWEAARAHAKQRNMEFVILTEKELGLDGRKK